MGSARDTEISFMPPEFAGFTTVRQHPAPGRDQLHRRRAGRAPATRSDGRDRSPGRRSASCLAIALTVDVGPPTRRLEHEDQGVLRRRESRTEMNRPDSSNQRRSNRPGSSNRPTSSTARTTPSKADTVQVDTVQGDPGRGKGSATGADTARNRRGPRPSQRRSSRVACASGTAMPTPSRRSICGSRTANESR